MNDHNKIALKTALQGSLQTPQLNPQQLDKLMQLQAAALQPEPVLGPKRDYWQAFSTAALLVLMLGLGFWLGGYQQHVESQNIPHLIAYEVVSNHLKDKPMDLHSTNFTQVKNYFTELDFQPFNSRLWSGSLIGGRYCSLRTAPSAQMRYYDDKGVKQTLYQTEYSEQYFAGLPSLDNNEAPLIASAKGVDVAMWVEKGVVFVNTQASQ